MTFCYHPITIHQDFITERFTVITLQKWCAVKVLTVAGVDICWLGGGGGGGNNCRFHFVISTFSAALSVGDNQLVSGSNVTTSCVLDWLLVYPAHQICTFAASDLITAFKLCQESDPVAIPHFCHLAEMDYGIQATSM